MKEDKTCSDCFYTKTAHYNPLNGSSARICIRKNSKRLKCVINGYKKCKFFKEQPGFIWQADKYCVD